MDVQKDTMVRVLKQRCKYRQARHRVQLQIMQRVEDELRIPMNKWALCSQHHVLTPETNASDCPFATKTRPSAPSVHNAG